MAATGHTPASWAHASPCPVSVPPNCPAERCGQGSPCRFKAPPDLAVSRGAQGWGEGRGFTQAEAAVWGLSCPALCWTVLSATECQSSLFFWFSSLSFFSLICSHQFSIFRLALRRVGSQFPDEGRHSAPYSGGCRAITPGPPGNSPSGFLSIVRGVDDPWLTLCFGTSWEQDRNPQLREWGEWGGAGRGCLSAKLSSQLGSQSSRSFADGPRRAGPLAESWLPLI